MTGKFGAFGRNPSIRIICLSYSQDLALKHARLDRLSRDAHFLLGLQAVRFARPKWAPRAP